MRDEICGRLAAVRRDLPRGQSPDAWSHALWICSLDIRPERGARRAWMQHGDLQQAQGKQTGRLRRDVFDLQLLQKRRALRFHGLLIMMGAGKWSAAASE